MVLGSGIVLCFSAARRELPSRRAAEKQKVVRESGVLYTGRPAGVWSPLCSCLPGFLPLHAPPLPFPPAALLAQQILR